MKTSSILSQSTNGGFGILRVHKKGYSSTNTYEKYIQQTKIGPVKFSKRVRKIRDAPLRQPFQCERGSGEYPEFLESIKKAILRPVRARARSMALPQFEEL
ncbi:hypothetical protein DYY62_04255 [Pasteurella multocida]|nr:hypothetical protein DYY62_04255 [Pasteurella multocida]